MPRFYFDLASNDEHMIDAGGKDLGTLNDAYDYALKLIDKILFHVGDNDADTWKVIISNDEHDAQMIALYFDALNDRAACEESEAVLFFAGWRSLRPCEQTLCSHVMRF